VKRMIQCFLGCARSHVGVLKAMGRTVDGPADQSPGVPPLQRAGSAGERGESEELALWCDCCYCDTAAGQASLALKGAACVVGTVVLVVATAC
jgi:hypothetical protein